MGSDHRPPCPPCCSMKLDLCGLEMITLQSIALLGGNAAKMLISSEDDGVSLNLRMLVWVSVHLPAHVLMTSGLITE